MYRLCIVCLLLTAPLHAAAPPARDPLPPGVVARLGHARMVVSREYRSGALVVSPDGRWVLAHDQWFRLADGRRVAPPVFVPKGHTFERFFADGSYAVSRKNQTLIFAPDSATPRATIAAADLEFDRLGRACLHFSWKGDGGEVLLANVRPGGKIEKWRKIATYKSHSGAGLSDSGGHVAWSSQEKPPRLSVYDVGTARLMRIDPKIESDSIGSVALSPDGKVVACSDGARVHLFDTRSGKPIRTDTIEVTSFALQFAPDSKSLVVRTWSRMAVIPTAPAGAATELRLDVDNFALFPDSRRVAVISGHGVLRIHDLKTGKQLDPHSRFPSFKGVRMIGPHVAASWSFDGRVVTWDVRDGRVLTDATLKPTNRFDESTDVRFSPDGRHVVAWSKTVCLLAETASGRAIRELKAEESEAFRAFFHPVRAEVMIYVADEGAYVCYDRVTGNRLRTLPGAKDEQGQFRPDGQTFVAASDEAISLRETSSGKARWTKGFSFTSDENRRPTWNGLCHLALADRGRRAVVIRAQDASAYDTQTGRMTCHVSFRSYVYARPAAVSACGRWLAVKDEEEVPGQEEVEPRRRQTFQTIRVFDLAAKDPTKDAFKGSLPCPDVRALTLDADGSRLVTAHGDGTCLVWDVRKLVVAAPKRKAAGAWELLADLDPSEAQPAIEALASDEAKALKLFASRLTPAVAVDAKRVAAWIADLDAEDFDRRIAAERRLAEAGDQADDGLRQALRKPASVEQARRAEALLRRIEPKNDGGHLRHLRALEILEGFNTEEAIALVEKLTTGAPSARLTREAKASLRRLKKWDRD